jgi:hypothetical protein
MWEVLYKPTTSSEIVRSSWPAHYFFRDREKFFTGPLLLLLTISEEVVGWSITSHNLWRSSGPVKNFSQSLKKQWACKELLTISEEVVGIAHYFFRDCEKFLTSPLLLQRLWEVLYRPTTSSEIVRSSLQAHYLFRECEKFFTGPLLLQRLWEVLYRPTTLYNIHYSLVPLYWFPVVWHYW